MRQIRLFKLLKQQLKNWHRTYANSLIDLSSKYVRATSARAIREKSRLKIRLISNNMEMKKS